MKMIVIFAVLTSLPFAFPKDIWSCFDAIIPFGGIIKEVPPDSPVIVKFTGRENKACHMFSAICKDALPENCEVCATVVGIKEKDCSVQLEFLQLLGVSLPKTVRTETCLERDIEPYCSTFSLGMIITKTDNSLTSASFEILLTAKIPAETNWGAIAGVIVGLIVIVTVVISIIVYFVACRKHRAWNQRQSPAGSTAPLTHLSSPSYQMDESYTLQTSKGNNNTKPPN